MLLGARSLFATLFPRPACSLGTAASRLRCPHTTAAMSEPAKGKQPSVASFFGAPSGGAKRGAASAAAAGDAPPPPPAAGAADDEPGPSKGFKRLRRAAPAEGAAAAPPDVEVILDSDEEGDAKAKPPPPAAAAAAPAAAKPAAAAPKRNGGGASAAAAPVKARPAAAPAAAAAPAGADADDGASDDASDEEEADEAEAEAEEAKGGKKKGKADAGGAPKRKAAPAKASVAHVAAAELAKYDVAGAAEGLWKAGAPVPFVFLARTFEAIGETTKRLEIDTLLANCLRTIMATTPADVLPAIYLATCSVAPAYEAYEMGVGDALLIKALAESTGRSEAFVKEKYGQLGDLGIVAMQCRATQKTLMQPAALTVRGVFGTLRDIAKTEGAKSTDRKRALIQKMLVASRETEAGYVARLVQGKLRIGLAQQTVVSAVAHAALMHEAAASASAAGDGKPALHPTSLAERLQAADGVLKGVVSECPSWDLIVPALLAHGIDALPAHCHFIPGVPVKPMLAKATGGVAEIVERFADVEFSCEYKYDGERAQVHVLENGDLKVFSRNSEEMTQKYPEIVARFRSHLRPGVRSCVLDCEAVAYDTVGKKILPFQVLTTRKKKDVAAADVTVHVCLFAFDCLFADGRTLLREPLSVRRAALYAALTEKEGELQFAVQHTSKDLEELSAFLDEAVAANTEGLIVKAMDATYEPSKRSLNWLKLKKDYLEGAAGGDSLDLVVIGAWHGKGKRTGVYGAFLVACLEDDTDNLQSITKLGTGFSEAQLAAFHEQLEPTVVPKPLSNYVLSGDTRLVPDVWFSPTAVWEIKAADLSISPMHTAAIGLVDPAKGIGLRFPRLLRVRDDKKVEDATTASMVAGFYRNQKINTAAAKHELVDEDDG